MRWCCRSTWNTGTGHNFQGKSNRKGINLDLRYLNIAKLQLVIFQLTTKTPVMAALSTLGIIHTAISLVAVATGIISLIRYREISWRNMIGKTYVVATIFTCVTGFGIFHHGGFGKAHVLGIITLFVLAIALASGEKTRVFGRFSPYVETVCYSMTFFFHIIPGVTETATRLPVNAPLSSSPDDPHIQMIIGISFLVFLVGATLQVLKIRGRRAKAAKEGRAVA